MMEAFFGFKKTPFSNNPDAKQLFASQAWTQVKARLQFLVEHHGAGLLTGEVGSGKSTAARSFSAALNPNLYKILYLHWTPGSTLDLLRQLALELDLEPAHYRGDLVRQISQAIVRLNQSKKQHPILICDEAQLLCHSALEQLPLLLNFDMDSSRYLTLLLVGQPLLRRTLSLQMHEPLRQRIAVQYHLEGLTPSFECEYRVRNGGWRWLLAKGRCLRATIRKARLPPRFSDNSSAASQADADHPGDSGA